MRTITVYTDGASRGNPGLAASSWLIMDGVDVLEADSLAIGTASNNYAEYTALITALKHASRYCTPGDTQIDVFSDSELMIKQLNGTYSVKSMDLRPLYQEVVKLSNAYAAKTFTHVPRENPYISSCDWMCNRCLDTAPQPEPEMKMQEISCVPIGIVHSSYKTREETPRMGFLSNEESMIELEPKYLPATYGLKEGMDIFVLCWFDRSDRTVLQVPPQGPRGESGVKILGVFATRSPARPNTISLSLVKIISIDGTKLTVRGLDALDLTPVLDIKPYSPSADSSNNSLSL